jgi:hypothetical protein
LQRHNRACGFLPASCSDKTARAVSFPQVAATKPRVRFNIPQVAATGQPSVCRYRMMNHEKKEKTRSSEQKKKQELSQSESQ